MSQIINKAKHILRNSSSYIDLIFASDPNTEKESGAHLSLHPNCNHQIVSAKFNLKIYYTPLYKMLVLQYQKANSDLIQPAIGSFDWSKAFENVDVDKHVKISVEMGLSSIIQAKN